MSEPATTPETNPSPSGRAADGKFAPGNQFGPGNPFARRCAAFRTALMEAVTEQDIKDIAAKLRDDAKAGDKAAVKLLFQYVIGKPQLAVDPDTLDLQEMRTATWPPPFRPKSSKRCSAACRCRCCSRCGRSSCSPRNRPTPKPSWTGPPRRMRGNNAARSAPARRPNAGSVARKHARTGRAISRTTGLLSPSPNGVFGNNGFAEEGSAPSPNGDNGGMLDFLARLLHGRQLPPNGAPQT